MPRHELSGLIDGPASYVRARSLEHALEVITKTAGACALAGGTLITPEVALLGLSGTFVDLRLIPELAGISGDTTRGAKLGAIISIEELITAPALAGYTALIRAARSIGNPHVRRAGTVGGNVALRLSSASLPPALLVLDATVALTDTSRSIAELLAQGVPHGALITAIHIPPNDGRRSAYHKYAGRHATAKAIASVAISAKFDGARAKDARVAVGGLCRPVRLPKIEAAIDEAKLSDEQVAEQAAAEAPYQQHGRPPAEAQRRRLVKAAIKRLLKELRNP